jgi:hypothetical protein
VNPHTRIETGSSPSVQLYNIKDDIGQQINRAEEQPAKAAEMAARLQEIIGSVGTRPGYLKP